MDGTEGQEEREQQELLKELMDDGYISHDVALGVTRQIIGRGLKSLSDAQRDVYRQHIEPLFNDDEIICRRCQDPVTDLPLNERYTLIRPGAAPCVSIEWQRTIDPGDAAAAMETTEGRGAWPRGRRSFKDGRARAASFPICRAASSVSQAGIITIQPSTRAAPGGSQRVDRSGSAIDLRPERV